MQALQGTLLAVCQNGAMLFVLGADEGQRPALVCQFHHNTAFVRAYSFLQGGIVQFSMHFVCLG